MKILAEWEGERPSGNCCICDISLRANGRAALVDKVVISFRPHVIPSALSRKASSVNLTVEKYELFPPFKLAHLVL